MKRLQTDGPNMRLQWSAILARKGHFVATRILNCLDGVGDQIESELPDQSSLVLRSVPRTVWRRYHRPSALCRSLFRICLASLLAAKTEFKTIASKMIQHPAVTIERIKPPRRVIELSVQTRLSGAAVPSRSGDP
jgi:hypothetical protein